MAAQTEAGPAAPWWRAPGRTERSGWKSFAIAMGALGVALVLAIYSGAAAETGRIWLAASCALSALALAIWVGFTIVPALARRTPLRWLAYQIDYKLTREGMVYIAGVFVVALAALNTGNNLLFMILASLLAGILISGVVSRIVLTGIELRLDVPEHIFAGQPIIASAELRNEKQTLPSFSLLVVSEEKKKRAPKASGREAAAQILTRPIYFPYIPRRRAVQQNVELVFPRRGVYRQEAFGIRTKFPFGFLQKTRRVNSEMEIVVYPRVSPTEEFYEVLPLVSGELESLSRGRGHDLYSIRDYRSTDDARHVDWKASAKTGALKVREFTREDERRVMLVLDPYADASAANPDSKASAAAAERFERGVALCACLAWHFYEIDSVIGFRSAGFTSPMAPASENIYDVLRHLAFAQPQPAGPGESFLAELAQETHVYKIILTSQPRGSIPTSLWSSSFFLFMQSL